MKNCHFKKNMNQPLQNKAKNFLHFLTICNCLIFKYLNKKKYVESTQKVLESVRTHFEFLTLSNRNIGLKKANYLIINNVELWESENVKLLKRESKNQFFKKW